MTGQHHATLPASGNMHEDPNLQTGRIKRSADFGPHRTNAYKLKRTEVQSTSWEHNSSFDSYPILKAPSIQMALRLMRMQSEKTMITKSIHWEYIWCPRKGGSVRMHCHANRCSLLLVGLDLELVTVVSYVDAVLFLMQSKHMQGCSSAPLKYPIWRQHRINLNTPSNIWKITKSPYMT